MKKIVAFIMGLVAFSTLNAANTANVTLTLSANGGTEASQVKLRLDPTVSSVSGASWFQNLEAVGTVNIYAKVGTDKYSQYKYNTLTNLPLEVVTNRRAASLQHYTIAFSVLVNTETLYLTDLVLDPNNENPIAIVDGESYEFDVNTTLHPSYVEGSNFVIADRFVINYDASAFMYNITLNNSYLATFSADEAVEIPTGLNAYAAEYQSLEQELWLHQISDYIPANTGVILYNPNYADDHKKEFSLAKHAAVPAISEVNHLSPATAYDPNHEGYVYVLSGSGMCIYEEQGQGMKPNKAFLQLPLSAPAPARIAFRFSEEQGVENISTEGKAVKFIENGRVFIKRGDKVYNLQGQLVK